MNGSKPVHVSTLNLVDLDRSEAAQVKNEKGTGVIDRGLKWLGSAVKTLSNGGQLQSSKNKLSLLLDLGSANTAIICAINPTSLNQSTLTLE